MAVAGVWSAALLVAACGDDDDAATSTTIDGGTETGTPDSSQPSIDAGSTVDASSGTDSGTTEDAGQDAGPTTTATLGAAGWIQIEPAAVFALFLEDHTIVRASNAPECVAHIGSSTKLFSNAGKITVGGQIVGSAGGPPQAVEVTPTLDTTGFPYAYFALDDGFLMFPPDDSLTLQVQTGGTATIGAVPVETLRPPPADPVTVTAPTVPDGGTLTVDSTLPLDIAWTAPDAGAEQRLVVGFDSLVSAQKRANVFCSYPLSAGKATIPANLLAEVRSRLGAATTGNLHIYVGGQKEAVVGPDSVVIEVIRRDSTSFVKEDLTDPGVLLQ